MTAIRETFEETGLLLASATSESKKSELLQSQSHPSLSLSEAALDAARESVHTGRTLFRDFLKQHALSADVKALLPFTEWITPFGSSRCVRVLMLLLSYSLTQFTTQHAVLCLQTTTVRQRTAASTRVSTSLSCPLTARPRPRPRPRPASHSHLLRGC